MCGYRYEQKRFREDDLKAIFNKESNGLLSCFPLLTPPCFGGFWLIEFSLCSSLDDSLDDCPRSTEVDRNGGSYKICLMHFDEKSVWLRNIHIDMSPEKHLISLEISKPPCPAAAASTAEQDSLEVIKGRLHQVQGPRGAHSSRSVSAV